MQKKRLMQKKFLIKLIEWLAYSIAAVLVFLAVLLSTARILLPYAPDYQARAEAWASKILQQPVEVEQVEPAWRGFQPELKFKNVQILNKDHSQTLIQVKEADVGINLLESLFTWRIVPGVIVISGADLTVTQDANHKITVNGIQAPSSQTNSNDIDIKEMLGWLFAQGKIYLQNINVTWHDASGRILTLQNVKLNLNNNLLSHELLGEASLEQATPTHIRFVLNLDNDVLTNPNFEAQLYFHVKKLVLNQWLNNRSFAGLSVDSGTADGEVWINWENQHLQSLQTKFSTNNILLKSKASSESITFNKLAGNVLWQREKKGWSIAGDQMDLVINNHAWPKTAFSYQSLPMESPPAATPANHASQNSIPANNAPAMQNIFQMSYLDIQDAKTILLMTSLVPGQLKQLLTQLQPQGVLKKTNFSFETPSSAATQDVSSGNLQGKKLSSPSSSTTPSYAAASDLNLILKTSFDNFTCLRWQKIPGVNHLTGNIVLNPTSGSLNLQSKNSSVDFGRLFAKPLEFTSLTGSATWEKQNQGWNITAKKISASDNAVNAEADMELTIPNNQTSPEINLSGNVNIINAPSAMADLPIGIMPNAVVSWLHSAIIRDGQASASIVLSGPLQSFPFPHKEGRFIVDGNFTHATLNYHNSWPIIENMNGHLLFDDASMQIQLASGKIFSATINNAQAMIPNLREANLQVTGSLSGDLNDGYLFLQQSPLYNTIGKGLEGFVMHGPMNVALQLSIPIAKNLTGATQVNGHLTLKNGDLLLPEWWNIHVKNLQGALQFTANSLSGNIAGQFYNQPITVGIATQQTNPASPAVTQINFSNVSLSTQQIEDLFAVGKFPFISGTTQYGLQLQLTGGVHPKNQLTIHSNLQGIALDLPAPFAKNPNSIAPFDLQLNFSDPQNLQWMITYNNSVDAALSYKKTLQGIKLSNADIHLGAGSATFQTLPGVVIDGQLNEFSWADWKNILSPYMRAGKTSDQVSLLRKIDLQIGKFILGNQVLSPLHLQLEPQAGAWNVTLDSPAIAGNMIVPTQFPQGQLVGNFDHVFIPAGTKEEGSLNAGEIPALKININDFHYGDKDVGGIGFNVAPQGRNTLQILGVNMKSSTSTLNAHGSWVTRGDGQQTFLTGQLSSQDFGSLLKAWDITNTLVGASGTANFNLRWHGLPYEPALNVATMNGNVHLQFANGRIINLSRSTNAELGIGRVLNLFSLSSLPRRLRLDFSDLTEEGLSFDVMQGDFVLKNGNAITNNAFLNGTVVKIAIKGRIGLSKQDYDLDLLVAPHVTASVPVVATITGGPLVGAISWLVEKVVGSAVSKLTTDDYHVTGSWANPIVEKREYNAPR